MRLKPKAPLAQNEDGAQGESGMNERCSYDIHIGGAHPTIMDHVSSEIGSDGDQKEWAAIYTIISGSLLITLPYVSNMHIILPMLPEPMTDNCTSRWK